jgi:DNA-binding transcriptional ArsR family regulator
MAANGVIDSRLVILEQIAKSPGIRYRELLRSTGLSNGVLEHHTTFVLEHERCTFNEILKHTKKAPSTLSWHLKRLSRAAIISVTYGQEYQLYQVLNSKFVEGILYKYGESFREQVVNGYYPISERL